MWVCLPCFANIFRENVCLGMLSKSNAQGVLLMTSVHFLRYFPKYDFCRHPPYRATFTRESRSRKRLLKNPGALLQKLNESTHTVSACAGELHLTCSKGLPAPCPPAWTAPRCPAAQQTYCSPVPVPMLSTNGISSLSVFPRTSWCFSMFMTHCKE